MAPTIPPPAVRGIRPVLFRTLGEPNPPQAWHQWNAPAIALGMQLDFGTLGGYMSLDSSKSWLKVFVAAGSIADLPPLNPPPDPASWHPESPKGTWASWQSGDLSTAKAWSEGTATPSGWDFKIDLSALHQNKDKPQRFAMWYPGRDATNAAVSPYLYTTATGAGSPQAASLAFVTVQGVFHFTRTMGKAQSEHLIAFEAGAGFMQPASFVG